VQTAAASAVGRLITVFALQQGLHPIRLVRSRESAARLAVTLPGGDIIDTATAGWQEAVRGAAAGGIALAVDGVGGELVGEIGALLNVRGRLVSYGMLADAPADLTLFVPKALSLLGASIGTWAADATPEVRVEDMRAAIEIGRGAPEIFAEFRHFELSELDRAITAVAARGKTGNVVLKF
jgi:NADPH2:quinone reductase